jgi:predicted GNAT superfamily acetyltransferase
VTEFETLLDIQRAVWGHDDLDVTPIHQFCVSSRLGGILIGAFVGLDLAGFVYSFPALFGKRHIQHSHLLAVRPELQGLGLGKRLKRAQRAQALRRGYDLITWTFDPLQARNANLNLQALGAFSRTYLPNFYGLTPALCLGPGIPTDRLLIEWPIKTRRVAERLAGRKPKPGEHRRPGPAGLPALPKALERTSAGEPPFVAPAPPRLGLRDEVVLVEVPKDIKALVGRPDLIAAWQSGLRQAMTRYFARGYRADHFLFGDRAFYVLRQDGKKKSST